MIKNHKMRSSKEESQAEILQERIESWKLINEDHKPRFDKKNQNLMRKTVRIVTAEFGRKEFFFFATGPRGLHDRICRLMIVTYHILTYNSYSPDLVLWFFPTRSQLMILPYQISSYDSYSSDLDLWFFLTRSQFMILYLPDEKES